jgi:hypothetical protein
MRPTFSTHLALSGKSTDILHILSSYSTSFNSQMKCSLHQVVLILKTKSCRTVEDFDDWTNWLFYKGGVGVQIDNSWEAWWFDEQVSHIPSS